MSFNSDMELDADSISLSGLSDIKGEKPEIETEEVRRHRRLIANSNERRRMQGINNGFEALRGFLACSEDQKLSKAAILQKTVSFIQTLLNEKSDLIIRNAQLEKMVNGGKPDENPAFPREVFVVQTNDHAVPIVKQEAVVTTKRKRKASTTQIDSMVDDEGVASLYSEHSGSGEDLQSEVTDLREETKRLRLSLETERMCRRNLETQIRNLQIANQALTDSARYAQEHYVGKIGTISASMPGVIVHDETPRCRTVSRNNLESIVEAIRRLEGDHLFADEDDHNQLTPSPGSPSAAVEEVEVTTVNEDMYITP